VVGGQPGSGYLGNLRDLGDLRDGGHLRDLRRCRKRRDLRHVVWPVGTVRDCGRLGDGGDLRDLGDGRRRGKRGDGGRLRDLRDLGDGRDALALAGAAGGVREDVVGRLGVDLATGAGFLTAEEFQHLALDGEAFGLGFGGLFCEGAGVGVCLLLLLLVFFGRVLFLGGLCGGEFGGGGDAEADAGGGVEIGDLEPGAAVVVPVGGDPDEGLAGIEAMKSAFVGPAIDEPLVRLGC
jgi:hypothetical protein